MTAWDWSKIHVREVHQDGLPKKGEPFVVLSLAWAAKAAAATASPKVMVWIWLVQQVRKTRRDTIAVSNEVLARYGVSRKLKSAALRQLEAAGLVTVKRCAGKAPLVTLLQR
jgi:hypothetical protein